MGPGDRDHLEMLSARPFLQAEVRAVNDLGPIYRSISPRSSSADVLSRRSRTCPRRDARGHPESAVTLRDRKKMTFLVTGDRSVAVEVTGIPVSGKRFLVKKGLEPGDLVIASGADAAEGEVRIW